MLYSRQSVNRPSTYMPSLPATTRAATPSGHTCAPTHLRAYNCAFAFTSVSYEKDTRIDFSGGIQCFQIHGQLFHYHGPLQPPSRKVPSFAQLFFYDPAYATDIRANQYSQLDRTILLQLTEMLMDCNPFIPLYKTARERLAT
jgi:hypothetical protein